MVDLRRAAALMEEALKLLDEAGEHHAAALLDNAICVLPPEFSGRLDDRLEWLADDDNSSSH